MNAQKSPTQATCYFDVISPFSWRPILFAALLEHSKHLDKGDLSTALSLRGCPGHAPGLRRRA